MPQVGSITVAVYRNSAFNGEIMDNKRNTRRISDRKKSRPKIRFNIWVMIIIFVLSFAACFVLYMLAANFNDNFVLEESSIVVEETPTENTSVQQAEDEGSPEPQKKPRESVTNPVPQSSPADASEHFSKSCLITDSTIAEMAGYTAFKDVLTDPSLNAAACNTAKIESSFGTVTAYETIKLKKPQNVYLMLGSDIGTSEVSTMISEYTNLIENLTEYFPDMNIYIMQLPPVIADTETVKNETINDYNKKLLALADKECVYCLDTNTALKSVEGNLKEEYWSAETKTLSPDAYSALASYILSHVA